MSRVGKKPIPVPSGVTVTIQPGSVHVKGPKGELTTAVVNGVTVEQEDGKVLVKRGDDSREQRAFHGLVRSLVANSIKGVSEGFKKELTIVGIGYKAVAEGKDKVVFHLGYSHTINFPVPDGISISVDKKKQTTVLVEGFDRQQVGQVAAEIRALRKPEPYKGKGVRYENELIVRKEGKKK